MLLALDIRDMLIIDRLNLEFASGLNVLTGETGAGKSILLDCLQFVLGGRGRADLLRQGAQMGEVTAVFSLPENSEFQRHLQDSGIIAEDELILRRQNSQDGRKSQWINGQRVTADVLRELAPYLLEIHGQHDDRGLLNAKAHRALLDHYAGNAMLRTDVQNAWRDLSDARDALRDAQKALNDSRAEEEYLRHAAQEIAQLAPQTGEEAQLDTRRRMMQAAEKTAQSINAALQSLGYEGAEGAMGAAARWLEDAAPHLDGALDGALDGLVRAQNELADATSAVERVIESLQFDQSELELCEERLFALRALARKHNCSTDDLVTLADEFAAKISAIDGADAQLGALEASVNKAQSAYDAAAHKLRASRQKAAKALDIAMPNELAPLKMERAVFATQLDKAPAGPHGIDEVRFSVATNPGAPAGDLGKIASGGELSRFLLALKLCLHSTKGGPTMIFDEIDRGVGGATADAVGARLARLARDGQVLVVTHSPQVASKADQHMQVRKDVRGAQTFSTVDILSDDARRDEIARMLSGDQLTDAARIAADALINAAK